MVQAVVDGQRVAEVAARFAVDIKTVRKWVKRFAEQGALGLCDRSSRPHRSPKAIARGTAQRVMSLRRRRWTMATIATELGISRATCRACWRVLA
jgi:transposase